MSGVRVHEAARRELTAAVAFAERERRGRGVRLREAVDRTMDRIAAAPEQGRPYLHGTRRFVLLHFPYSTGYVTLEVGFIVAVAHHRRRPGYWRKRLRAIH